MLKNLVEVQKKEYMSEIKRKTKFFNNIYIYGAGKIANIICGILNILEINFTGYCVSEIEQNFQIVNNKKVVGIDDLLFDNENTLFLLAVKPSKEKELIKYLEKKGYTNFIKIPNLINYFEEEKFENYLSPEMEITVGIGCRVNCKYCPQKNLYEKYQGNRIMNFNTFKICIDKLPQDTTIIFSGFCEPFLNEDCVDMILYAFKKNMKVKLFTTLEGLTIEKFEQISKLNFEEVVLHLPDKFGYAHINTDKKYIELLERVVDSQKSNGENFISYANSQFAVSENIMEIVQGKVRITGEMCDRAGNLKNEELPNNIVDTKKKRFCTRAYNLNHNVLLPNGDVVLCCNDFALRHKYGNLILNSYEEVVINSKERKFLFECLYGLVNEDILCNKCSNIQYFE